MCIAYLTIHYLNLKIQYIAIIALNLPSIGAVIMSFLCNYILLKLIYPGKLSIIRAIYGPFGLIIQLTSAFYFASCVAYVN